MEQIEHPKALPDDVVDAYELSPLQHGMLFHNLQAGRGQGVDIEQLEAKLSEAIDPEKLERAFRAVAARHPALRTRFRWEGQLEAPRQEVVREVPVAFQVRDVVGETPSARESWVASFLAEDRARGLDLSVAPVWRVTLLRMGPAEYRMVWTYSHAILDSCYADVLREVFEGYEARRRGEEPRLSDLAGRPTYHDHITWLGSHVSERREEAARFWRARLEGFSTPTDLRAVARASVDAAVSGHDTLKFALSSQASDAIRAVAATHDVRVSTFIDAAWALVLGAFSAEDDVVFGSTRACRRSSIPGAEAIIGLFINTVPVRARVAPETAVIDFLRAMRAEQLAVRRFEHTPLVDTVSYSEVPRGTQLFRTIVVFNDRDNDVLVRSLGVEWDRRHFELHDQTNFEFNVMAYGGPRISFKLSYDRQRFDRATVDRVATLLGAVLEGLAQKPLATLGELDRLPPADARAIFGAFNATRAEVTGPACIHEAFEAQVDRTPEARALVFRGQSLTYRELDARANRVAHELVALGMGSDGIVGLFVERSIEMVVGLLAILKAGAAYLPMDPAYPRDRIATVLEDARAAVVLTLGTLRSALPPSGATVLALDAFGTERSEERLGGRATGDNLAYVIFTSGSTGRPKGVQIEHRNVANFFAGMDQALGRGPGVWLALTSIAFDISVLEILWTLSRGFTVIVQEEANRAPTRTRPIGFSLFYFAADSGGGSGGKYELLLNGAKFADTHEFEAVWTPERHFHPFGGLYPNPSLTSAALAVLTKNVGIRAGSVVLPLHSPIRCAEEWSVVDNLSNGRVGLSFASGWHAADFALAPANFKGRRELMARGIETIRALWRGESIGATSGDGNAIQIKMYPPPVQREPPIWITASGNPDTFATAGRMGVRVLTNLLVMRPEELIANIGVYRKAYRDAGHGRDGSDGHVTLMLHTFVGRSEREVREAVRGPFLEYLRTSTDLINKARWELTAFAKGSDSQAAAPPGATMDLDDLSADDMAALLDHAYQRYFATAGLFGTPESCVATVNRLRAMGINEIACLIDFGVNEKTVLDNLEYLDALRRRTAVAPNSDQDGEYAIARQIHRHGVTHMQCTPSLLAMLATDDESLAAVASLDTLLVGGEALPPTLVDRLRASYRGVIRNMYGPTETTVWSTTTLVDSAAAGITIGRPMANTRVYVVDRHLRPLPIGVPGELLIGGWGVARGYLGRPSLTAERFVRDPFGNEGERLYRTGDLARWLPSGELEYLGRNDHQVKVRGYRIELGEIEAVLGAHPGVRESVVVARTEPSAEVRLTAYVVASRNGARGDSASGATDGTWRTVWDETYREAQADDAAFNVAGWRSSFNGEPIAPEEMREWVEATTARILTTAQRASSAGAPDRILEIGCGTGLLLFRLAPRCERYVGVDFSRTALDYVRSHLDEQGIHNVELECLAADAMDDLAAPGPFGTVILNSVVQYFPDVAYLQRVLRLAWERVAPGGALVVGDVRSLAHLRAFHAAVELARAPGDAPLRELSARIDKRIADERELVVDAGLFEALGRHWGNLAEVSVDLKQGRAHNEMNCFRFDVVLRKNGGGAALTQHPIVREVAAPEPCTEPALRALLREEPASLRVVGVPNARVIVEVEAAARIALAPAGAERDARELLAALAPLREVALDPDDLRHMHPHYDVSFSFTAERPGAMNVEFRHRNRPEARTGGGAQATGPTYDAFESFANRPARPVAEGAGLIVALREHVRAKLPDYMIPSAFVVLESLPLTPNGKVNRAALPAPERTRVETTARFQPPKNELEQHIVSVLAELVGVAAPGVDDNFFDLGANSLMLVQVSVRLRDLLGRPVPLVRLFQFPTARSLATVLAQADAPDESAPKEGQDRAQVRRTLANARTIRGRR